MTTFAAIAWAPAAFLLHIFLHELAHFSVVRLYGVAARMRPYPHLSEEGRFVWGLTWWPTEAEPAWRPVDRALIAIAPMILEALWCLAASGALVLGRLSALPSPLRAVLAVEALAALVDAFTWIGGFFTERVWTDAMKFQRALGLDLVTAQLVAVQVLSLFGAVVVAAVWLSF